MTPRLERFIAAQKTDYATALAEITAGEKRSHWMWYIFPQLGALGHSPTAKRYGIHDLDEAHVYLADPLLGRRLVAITQALLAHHDAPIEAIMGPVDAKKLRSTATLFEAAGGDVCFAQVLDVFYDGERCHRTLAQIAKG